MNVASVEKLRPVSRELHAALTDALGHAEHGTDWQLTQGWGKEAKRRHAEKYHQYLAAILPLLGYEPRPTGSA